jgi:hypothetical protein
MLRHRRWWSFAAASLIALVLVVALVPSQARQLARQIQFGQWSAGSDIVFDYRVADFHGVEHRIGFRLAREAIDEGRALIHAFSNNAMASAVEAELRDYLKREAPDVQPRFERDGNSVGVSLQGPSEKRVNQVLAALDGVYRRAQDDYLHRLYMRDVNKTIYLDYTRLAEHYTAPLKPLAQAIAAAASSGGGGDERTRLALALAFFQTMPYDPLTDHDVSNGIDFIAPPVLLNLNRGDCDSQAVALGAVLHSLLPGRRLIIVLLPHHAIVGIDLAVQGEERSLLYQGRRYVLMETAGPAAFAIGTLFPDTDSLIRSQRVDLVMPL